MRDLEKIDKEIIIAEKRVKKLKRLRASVARQNKPCKNGIKFHNWKKRRDKLGWSCSECSARTFNPNVVLEHTINGMVEKK